MTEQVIPSKPPPATDDGDAYAHRVGEVVKGKWTIDSLLGVGGMAAVYAATHRNGQRAALKILHIDFAKDKTVCDRFLREAYVSNKIGHSACVAVLDDDRTDLDEPYLVMELLEGETLRELWMHTGRRMPVPKVLEIVDPILDCLASCHAMGVIHRDLKPANIFITKEAEVKVLDFGVAQFRSATAERTATGTALGTPSYMSPEQAMGLVDQLDGRADLFSVGAILHALITGHRINKGRTENEALVMAATTPVPSVARIAPDLPVEVIALIDKSLAWDRRNRFDDAKAMREGVRYALRTLGVEPAPSKDRAAAVPVNAPPSAQAAHGAPAPEMPAHALVGVAHARTSEGAQKAAPAADAKEVRADDPRISELRDVFKRIDRVLPSVKQLGWEHPATERALRVAFEGIVDALKANPRAVQFSVMPYSFMLLGHTVWEPVSPFDAVPYNLFACGIRAMRIKSQVALEELRGVLAIMLLEPGRDLPPEDDLAAAFWEKHLTHVEYDVVDAFAEGDAAEREAFFQESDQLEKVAESAARAHEGRLEARAMAVSTDDRALAARARHSPMALDDVVRAVYASQLEQPRERWSERYVDVLAEALVDAAKSRDAQLVLASLRKSAADLVVAGRVDVVTQLHQALLERLARLLPGPQSQQLSAALTSALFGAETFELMLKRLHSEPNRVPAFEPVLAALSPKELPTVLAAMRTSMPPVVAQALLRYVERVLPGNEMEIAAKAAGLDVDVTAGLLRVLASAQTPAARQALTSLGQSEDVALRIEAKVLISGNPESAQADLASMCESSSAIVRMAALKTTARHMVRSLWPTVARHAKQPNFHELGSDERVELMRTLIVLAPERGEPLAIEIAKKSGVFISEEKEASRTAAIEALGQLSRSATTAAALREIAQARWGTTDETRAAAHTAADLISHRISQVAATSAAPSGGAPS